MEREFDVAVIGAGVSGASVARTLSAYRVSCVLIEKCADVGFGVSKANSGIIHAGFHHAPATLKARLEIRGNLLFDKLHYELGFPFKRVGILVAAFSDEEMKTVEYLYNQGLANGVVGLEICGGERIRRLEPKINPDVVGGLYAPSGGIIEPYRFVFALVESAMKNGVELKLNFEVAKASVVRGVHYLESTGNEKLRARYVVNAAGLYADEVSGILGAEEFRIEPRKGEEYLLDRNAEAYPSHVLFPVPAKNSKGVLVIPTVEGTTMIGPTAQRAQDKNDTATTPENLDRVFTLAKHMVPAISRRAIISSFAGLRPTMAGDDFYIQASKETANFIHVAGIQSPGLTAAPAIGEYVKDLLKKAGLALTEKDNFDPMLAKAKAVRGLSPEGVSELVKENPAYANLVCRCESVSEAEIVEAIRKGHTTLDGIKFYTRAGMGRCQGGFCTYKILKLISRETGIPIEAVTKRGSSSRIVGGTANQPLPPRNIPE